MKKLKLFLLSLFTVSVLSGCENIPDQYLKEHNDTMNNMDTYVISALSTKTNLGEMNTKTNFVYIDNVSNTFLVTKELKDEVTFDETDIIFEYDDDGIYGYIYDNCWYKYEVDQSYLNIKEFEDVLFSFFFDATVTHTEEEVIYRDTLTYDEIIGNLYNIFGEELPEEYQSKSFPITAYYNKELKRFTSFSLNLTDIYREMNTVEDELLISSNSTWIVEFSFTEFNKEFTVSLDEYVVDDYFNNPTHMEILNISNIHSYDMIKGSLDYKADQDIIKIDFEDDGLYRLSLRDITSPTNLFVKVLDSNFNEVRDLCVSSHDTFSDYWNYSSGTYYLVVNVEEEYNGITDYSFIFLGN